MTFASPGDPWVIRRLHAEASEHLAVHLEAFDTDRATAEQAGMLSLR
ncbi:hypothetical protein OG474_25155 [Kribbella sp. NBC_01505]